MNHLVFVYGSLKRGFGNHRCIPEYSEFVAETTTLDSLYEMRSYGAFPAVMHGGDQKIKGELYRVPDFYQMDRLESNGRFYQRERVDLANGMTAWMYLVLPVPPDSTENVNVVDGVAEWRKPFSDFDWG